MVSSKRKAIVTVALIIGLIASCITIFCFVTGIFTLDSLISLFSKPDGGPNTYGPEEVDVVVTADVIKIINADWKISASSSLVTNNSGLDYSANSAFDDNEFTSWIPGPSIVSEKETASGLEQRYGVGEYLEFGLTNGSIASIEKILIVNGAWKEVRPNKNNYYQNNRAKEISITFDHNYTMEYCLEDCVQTFQPINFDEPIQASHIRIAFLSVYEAEDNKYDEQDLMIGEVDIIATVESD